MTYLDEINSTLFLTRPKVYRCDSRSAAITAMGFEDSDSKDCDPIDSDS